jgi:c-di-GMP-binding flagellar brake protein YcgR
MATQNTAITEKRISDNSLSKQADLESIKLTSADDINHLLKKIFLKHSLLTITIGSSDECYGSTILQINNDDKYLVIDELHPEKGHDKIKVGTSISFNANYAGASVYFIGTVEAIGENKKAAYYKIGMPEEIQYHQRRNTYRITTTISEPVAVNLVNENEVLIKAELRDISHGGVCLRVNPASHISISGGDVIPTCLIQVNEERKILSSLNICHVEVIKETGSLRIGAEFLNMSKLDQRELEHFIASLERAVIKNIKRIDSRIAI